MLQSNMTENNAMYTSFILFLSYCLTTDLVILTLEDAYYRTN